MSDALPLLPSKFVAYFLSRGDIEERGERRWSERIWMAPRGTKFESHYRTRVR